MKTVQIRISHSDDLKKLDELEAIQPNFITIFGECSYFEKSELKSQVLDRFSDATIIGCSAHGEISEDGVFDDSLIISGAHIENADFRMHTMPIVSAADSEQCGRELAKKMAKEGLASVLVFGQGVNINGSQLVQGLKTELSDDVIITGGLAGDGAQFKKTYVIANNSISDQVIAAMGIYGDSVQVGYGSHGGWEPFGPVRTVTRSQDNVLFELDGRPALEVYKEYLGDHAKDLPVSGLLFPFAILDEDKNQSGLIRTILGIDEKEGSLILAGDMPRGGRVQLMHATNNNLVSGAEKAADQSRSAFDDDDQGFAILISCIGRKIVMGPDIDDEIEAVQEQLPDTLVTGFYSHGEICPLIGAHEAKLHNQTMTITYLKEKKAA